MGAILSTTMVLSMLAGCGTTNSTTETATGGTTTGETASPTAATETDTTPITFKIAVTKHALSKCDDFNDKVAFQMAEEDDLIRKNPFGFELVNVIVNDSVRREAVTRKQEREFLRFIKEDAHFCKYYDAIFILFNTGLRISEFCGLTKSDLDFKNKRIRVNHQLQRTSQMQYIIEKPKTESGERYVPMSDEVVACFKRILKDRVNPKVEPMVDGMTGFLFLDKNDMPMVALHWEKYFQHIREKYNSIYKVQMPPITPHVCRHTFCSNMAKSGMNPKMLQYIMGHSDISVTMNTYTHVKFQDAQEDFQKAINS